MKTHPILTIILSLFVCGHAPAGAQDMNTELAKLAEDLTGQITNHSTKKVTVLDLTDLDGNTSEIGKYVAEKLMVDFVKQKNRSFAILDRANLKRIMDEHKLTASGLVDPENAKKLGMFAGVDAMIFGKITPVAGKVEVSSTVEATDTAEIIAAGDALFVMNSTLQQLTNAPTLTSKSASNTENATGGKTPGADLSDDKPITVKEYGNLVVELQSMRILNTGHYFLTMTLTNRSARNSLWVALANQTSVISPNGDVFGRSTAKGLFYPQIFTQYGPQFETFKPFTEIKPRDSTVATLDISSSEGRPATSGVCTLQLQFLLANDIDYGRSSPKLSTRPNLVTKFEAK